MTQIEQLLKYQTKDSELLKIEKEAASSEEWKNYSSAKSFLTKAPEKLEAMDAKALEIMAKLESLNSKYDEIAETLKDFENIEKLVEEGGADISFYKKNVNQITDKLKSIKAEINALSKSVKEADEEYRSFKSKTINVQKQYSEFSAIYQEYKKSKLVEMDKVKEDLKVLAKDINPELLKRYETKRSERIFPIICSVVNNRCSKCGIELSIMGKEKIDGGEVIECENCHRFLYKG